MKKLKEYIIEGQNFLVNKKLKNRQKKYEYHPETKEELEKIIIGLLKQGEINLNCIDVSNITEMDWLFFKVNYKVTVKYIDVSEWDVSKVEDMRGMFGGCKEFNSDLSNWDVSNIKNISDMFYNCNKFNSDISNWNVANVTEMYGTFYNCKEFNSDLSGWIFKKTPLLNTDTLCGCDTLKKNNKIPDWYQGKV